MLQRPTLTGAGCWPRAMRSYVAVRPRPVRWRTWSMRSRLGALSWVVGLVFMDVAFSHDDIRRTAKAVHITVSVEFRWPARAASKVQRQRWALTHHPRKSVPRRAETQSMRKHRLALDCIHQRPKRREYLTTRVATLHAGRPKSCLREASAAVRRRSPRFGSNLAKFWQRSRKCW